MILPRHPDANHVVDATVDFMVARGHDRAKVEARHRRDAPWAYLPALGYWRIPLDPKRIAEEEAIIAGNGRARLPGGLTINASPEGARRRIQEMHADDKLPDPHDFVDLAWDVDERARVVTYLRAASRATSWMGYSNCRFCGCLNGTTCRSDGHYVWPEGFAHYIEEHGVRPPAEFAEHALRKRDP